MNFSEALKAMKMGSKVSREAWRGQISHWKIATHLIADKKSKGPIHEKVIREFLPAQRSGEIVDKVKTESILADDWWIVT